MNAVRAVTVEKQLTLLAGWW